MGLFNFFKKNNKSKEVQIPECESYAHNKTTVAEATSLVDFLQVANKKSAEESIAVVKPLNNQEDLAIIAKHGAVDPSAVIEAVEKMSDQNLLGDVAKTITMEAAIKVILEKLTDQNVLADIAKNAFHYFTRMSAIRKLTDQDALLADIVKNDKNDSVRMAATENLNNQDILTDVAKNDNVEYVRGAAKQRLEKLQGK